MENPVRTEKEWAARVARLEKRVEDLELSRRQWKETAEVLLHAAPDAAVIVDPQGCIVSWNDEAARRLDLEGKEPQGKCVYDFLPGETVRQRKAVVEQVARSGAPSVFRDERAGSLIENYVHPVLDDEGKVRKIVVFGRDITDRQRMEEALRISEREKSVILDSVDVLIAYQDPDHRVLWANEHAARSVGTVPENLVGRRCHEIWQGRKEPCEGCPVERTLETGELHLAEMAAPDGRAFFIRSCPVLDDEGRVAGVVEFSEDITERRKEQQESELNKARLEALFSLSQMSRASADEIAKFALEESANLTGSQVGFINYLSEDEKCVVRAVYTEETLRQCPLPVSLDAFEVAGCGLWSEAVRTRRPVVFNDYGVEHPAKKGIPRGHLPLKRFLSLPIFEEDRVVAVGALANKGTNYDEEDVRQFHLLMDGMWKIVQRRRAEERIRASLREKEVLLRELYHRTKNNMQVISGLINLQTAYLQDESAVKALEETQHRIRSMALVHEQLYQSEDLNSVDLKKYIQELGRMLVGGGRGARGSVGLELDLRSVPASIDTAIPCGLVVNELITNSLRHAFPSGRPGTIRIALEKAGEKTARLTVKDDGIGLPGDFSFAGTSSLGLQLVVNIVEKQLRGSIRAEEDRESGASFVIQFANSK